MSQQSDGFGSKKSTFSKSLKKFILRALAVGSAGLAAHRLNWLPKGTIQRADLAQLQKTVLSQFRNSRGMSVGGGGFWVGFAISSALSSSFILGAVNYINKVLNPNASYAAHPPRRKFRASAIAQKPKAVVVPVLDARVYRKFPLIEKNKLSHDSYRFVFALPNASDSIGIPTGQHVSIRASINGEVVSRSYTPTSNNFDLGRLELVVKCYPNGKLTTYLASLNVGDQVEFAGPKGAMKYSIGLCKHIGMVAGGSGITPMYQIIRAICEDPSDSTTVSLLYANRTENDILLREQLDQFATTYPRKFQVHYVLDSPPKNWEYSKGFVTKELMQAKFPAAGPDAKVMLCGPPPMVNAMKRNLADLGFQTPGALSRMTDQIFIF